MTILSRIPIGETPSEVATPEGVALVRPYQIVVSVSLAAQEWMELPAGCPRFPAILDTGNNYTFSIREEHLRRWVRLDFPHLRRIKVGDQAIPVLAANLWIHPNHPGTREVTNRPPFKLALKEGIAVYPSHVSNPARLPILGLRAIVTNRLTLIIDGRRRTVSLKTPGWFG